MVGFIRFAIVVSILCDGVCLVDDEDNPNLLICILVYNELLAPYWEHWINNSLFTFCLEAANTIGLVGFFLVLVGLVGFFRFGFVNYCCCCFFLYMVSCCCGVAVVFGCFTTGSHTHTHTIERYTDFEIYNKIKCGTWRECSWIGGSDVDGRLTASLSITIAVSQPPSVQQNNNKSGRRHNET